MTTAASGPDCKIEMRATASGGRPIQLGGGNFIDECYQTALCKIASYRYLPLHM